MKKKLQGLRVLNTRPIEQAGALSQAIKEAGGIAIECPALAIEATDRNWLTVLPGLQTIEQAIFISANAVTHFFNALAEAQLNWPERIQVISVGLGTAAALGKRGIWVDLRPEQADSEHLLALDDLQQVSEKTILLIKGQEGRGLIADCLRARGATLTIVEVYQRTMPDFNPQDLQSLWHNDAVDIILFTSQQAMNNIFSLFGENAGNWLRGKPCLVISERLARAAVLLGITTVIVASPETLLSRLQQFNQGLIDGQA